MDEGMKQWRQRRDERGAVERKIADALEDGDILYDAVTEIHSGELTADRAVEVLGARVELTEAEKEILRAHLEEMAQDRIAEVAIDHRLDEDLEAEPEWSDFSPREAQVIEQERAFAKAKRQWEEGP